MTDASRHDSWSAGDAYESYMGRWSRPISTRFVDWLAVPAGLDWLEVGCGSGALSSAILQRANPRSVLGIDQSEDFVATAQQRISDDRARFQVGDAQNLDLPDSSVDVVVSALVLNFIPDPDKALREMARVVRPLGTVGFYVWDYPGGGVEFMDAFWKAAATVDPAAKELDESKRFPDCHAEALEQLVSRNELGGVQSTVLEAPAIFHSFEDFWTPFTLGAGPAPGYCVSLPAQHRERLRETLASQLARKPDGSIPMRVRAWGVKATTAT